MFFRGVVMSLWYVSLWVLAISVPPLVNVTWDMFVVHVISPTVTEQFYSLLRLSLFLVIVSSMILSSMTALKRRYL